MEARPHTTERHTHTTGYARAVAVLVCLLVSGLVPQPSVLAVRTAVPTETPAPGGEEGGSDTEPASPIPSRGAALAHRGQPEAVPPGRVTSLLARPSDFHPSRCPRPPTGRTARPHVLRC